MITIDDIDELENDIKKQLMLLCAGCRDKCRVEMQTSIDATFKRYKRIYGFKLSGVKVKE